MKTLSKTVNELSSSGVEAILFLNSSELLKSAGDSKSHKEEFFNPDRKEIVDGMELRWSSELTSELNTILDEKVQLIWFTSQTIDPEIIQNSLELKPKRESFRLKGDSENLNTSDRVGILSEYLTLVSWNNPELKIIWIDEATDLFVRTFRKRSGIFLHRKVGRIMLLIAPDPLCGISRKDMEKLKSFLNSR